MIHIRRNENSIRLVIAIGIIIGAIALTLFRHWEPTHETWGYWLFARIFSETGKLNIWERSPLYVIYLNFFRWLGYPSSIIVEYIVTTFITSLALFTLFRPILGSPLAISAAVLWIPYIQEAEPPVQKVALTFACAAVIVRNKVWILRIPISYIFFGVATLFRPTYIIVAFVFFVYDVWDYYKSSDSFDYTTVIVKARKYSLVFLFIVIFFLIQLNQSSYSWNNQLFATSVWFPWSGKKFEALQNYNWYYIEQKYRTLIGHDFYFSNKELFRGASTTIGAMLANPRYIASFSIWNFFATLNISTSMTFLTYFTKYLPYISFFNCLLFAFIIYGAFRLSLSKPMKAFLIGNCVILIVTIPIFLPFPRYMYSLITIYTLSAYWYSQKIQGLLTGSGIIERFVKRIGIPVLFLALLSTGVRDWKHIVFDLAKDVLTNDIRVMETRNEYYNYSAKASYESLRNFAQKCTGIMTLEHGFIAAFTNVPLSQVFDVWEIPPFGTLPTSGYAGLSPARVNCLFISNELMYGHGAATNFQGRYQNYIKPYNEMLQQTGAEVYHISTYGFVVKGHTTKN